MINIRNQPNRAVDAYALALEVLAQHREEPQPDFLRENVEHILVRRPRQHARVAADQIDDLDGRLAGSNVRDIVVIAVGSNARVEVRGCLGRGADIFDLVHKDVDTFVQASGDTLIKHLLKTFLLFSGDGEEVVAIREVGCDKFLRVEDVDHLLDQVADVDELEEGDEGFNTGGLLRRIWGVAPELANLARVVGGQVSDGFVEAVFDMFVAEGGEEGDEDGFALFFCVLALLAAHS